MKEKKEESRYAQYARYGLYWLIILLTISCFYVGLFSRNNMDKRNEDINKSFIAAISLSMKTNRPFTLENVIGFSEFERACVVAPYTSDDQIKRDFGFPYKQNIVNDDRYWGLFLINSDSVVAEIQIDRKLVDYPSNLQERCLGREAFFSVKKSDHEKQVLNIINTGE